MVRWLKTAFLFCLALTLLWSGLSIPAFLRSVSPLVLQSAGENTDNIADLARERLQLGDSGPAELLWQANAANPPSESGRRQRENLLANHPDYYYSGGSAPYYEAFLQQLPRRPQQRNDVAAVLIDRENREHLLGFLRQSTNRYVARYLETRQLSGYTAFMPVYSVAGQPLDAIILTLALLEQANSWHPRMAAELRSVTELALDGDPQALREYEAVCAAMLSLAKATNWRQLETIAERLPDKLSLHRLAAILQKSPEKLPQIYAALLLADNPAELLQYMENPSSENWQALDTALTYGAGSVDALIRFNQPISNRPVYWDHLPAPLLTPEHSLRGFAEKMPRMAQVTKYLLLVSAGYLLILSFTAFFHGHSRRDPVRRVLLRADRLIAALLIGACMWILVEPTLLHFKPNQEGTLEINLASLLPSADTNSSNKTIMDQVTLLVLVFFFVVQIMVFFLGLIRMREIQKQSIPPDVKLHLLENEENLFDLGLYVGLGGTVSSLILVVLNIVDASLMAAYASTLFGIIFVALLKIGFLRRVRQQLILQTHSAA